MFSACHAGYFASCVSNGEHAEDVNDLSKPRTLKVQKEIRTIGMLTATNTRPIKAARHLKNEQAGYQFVFGPTARHSCYLSGHATFLLKRWVNQ